MSEPAVPWFATSQPAAGSSGAIVPRDNERHVYLYPGRLVACAESTTVSTILGSCVAVGMWDPARRIGGINHFLLPHGDAGTPKYANGALPLLIERLIELGAKRERIVAAVFGGATLAERDHFQLGQRNVEVAGQFLAAERIAVLREDVGGDHGRKVLFRTSDGRTEIRRL